MVKGDWSDPLLLQVLPTREEENVLPGFVTDAVGDLPAQVVPGLLHKYASRALMMISPLCAVHCRYCFRRHFPYDDHQLSRPEWQQALDYVRRTPEVNEVILSGGDPLSLGDKQLAWLVQQVAGIEHVKRLRIHTRYPIILPSRMTAELVEAVRHPRLRTVLVMHCNHPQEIDDTVCVGINMLRDGGIQLFNQTVLLKNINDNSRILATLSENLFDAGVLPYYLHLLDKVQGAAHFAVKDADAKTLYGELLTLLPGYLVPRLVRETPHEGSKTPVSPI